MMKDAEQLIGDKLGRTGSRYKRIDADNGRVVSRIDQDNIAHALRRDAREHVLNEVAFGLDDNDRSTRVNVLANQVEKQRRLAGPGGSQDVEASEPFTDSKCNRSFATRERRDTEYPPA